MSPLVPTHYDYWEVYDTTKGMRIKYYETIHPYFAGVIFEGLSHELSRRNKPASTEDDLSTLWGVDRLLLTQDRDAIVILRGKRVLFLEGDVDLSAAQTRKLKKRFSTNKKIRGNIMLPRLTTLAEWCRVFTNVDIWHQAVANILATEGLKFTAVTAGFPGCNAVFLADQAYVVKIFAPMFEADYTKELAVYKSLSGQSTVAAPTLLAHGHYNDGNSWPYLVTTFCPGVAIRDARPEMTPQQIQAVAEQLGKMIRTLHRIPINANLPAPLTWDNYFKGRIPAVISALHEKTLLAPEVTEALEEHLHNAQTFFLTAEALLVHADLTEDHLLLTNDHEQWSISGLIDFADIEVAPREYEWIPLWFGLIDCNPDALLSFMRSYDGDQVLDEQWRDRMLAMTFLHRYGVPIVASALGEKAKALRTLKDLKEALWPSTLLSIKCLNITNKTGWLI